MAFTCTQETWYPHHAAVRALKEAGGIAIDAIAAELEQHFSSDLVRLLLETGDQRAVPILKKVIARDESVLSAYGMVSKVQEFVAKFDEDVKEALALGERAERERLERARAAVQALDESGMVATLRSLCEAYTSNTTEVIDELEPIATAIAERLDATGGITEMRRIFAQVQDVRGARTLEMQWGGIGEWRG